MFSLLLDLSAGGSFFIEIHSSQKCWGHENCHIASSSVHFISMAKGKIRGSDSNKVCAACEIYVNDLIFGQIDVVFFVN